MVTTIDIMCGSAGLRQEATLLHNLYTVQRCNRSLMRTHGTNLQITRISAGAAKREMRQIYTYVKRAFPGREQEQREDCATFPRADCLDITSVSHRLLAVGVMRKANFVRVYV